MTLQRTRKDVCKCDFTDEYKTSIHHLVCERFSLSRSRVYGFSGKRGDAVQRRQ